MAKEFKILLLTCTTILYCCCLTKVNAQGGLPPAPHPWAPYLRNAFCQSTPALWPFDENRFHGDWTLSQFFGYGEIPVTSCATARIEPSEGGNTFHINLKWNDSPWNRTVPATNSIRKLGRWQSGDLFCANCNRAGAQSLIILSATYTEDRYNYDTVMYMTCGTGGNELGGLQVAPIEFGILKRGSDSYIAPDIIDGHKEVLGTYYPSAAQQLQEVSHSNC